MTIGPQSETPHRRPASLSQSFVTSSNHCRATCGWTCADAVPPAPSSASSQGVLKRDGILIVLSFAVAHTPECQPAWELLVVSVLEIGPSCLITSKTLVCCAAFRNVMGGYLRYNTAHRCTLAAGTCSS